jgi:dTDP-4-dehydrorhamnose reductase
MNVGLTRVLADLAHDVPFLFLSTDLVFDGRKGDYTENDAVNPLSVYAETKARAEEIVLANPLHTVVRLALNTGISPTGARSFTEEMRRAAARGERLSLFTDEWRTPLPAVVTARVLWELLAGTHPPGLYHLGGGERLSRWEIGQLVARRWPALAGNIQPASLRDFTGPPRPADTSLNCAKIQAHLPFKLPGLRQWMNENPGEPV